MRPMYDAATPPATFPDSEVWGGYLQSPSAAAPWPDAQLHGAMRAGGLLPIYLAPLSPAGHKARDAKTDAQSAVRQVKDLEPDRIVVALDTEPQAFSSSRRACLSYAVTFNREVHRLGGVCVHYGPPAFLKALGSRARMRRPRSRIAWLAWWTSTPTWPKDLARWPHPRAWQYANDQPHAGANTDFSRIDDDFPRCRPHKAAAVDADRALAAAMRGWLKTKGL